MAHDLDRAGALLTIDLAAIAANWRFLAEKAKPARCAAVVKADAYGLGIAQVAPALAAAGCTRFFVATLDEGIELRGIVGNGAEIFVLNGPVAATAPDFIAYGLIPALNTLDQAQCWSTLGRQHGDDGLACALHVDTGMNRLGLSMKDAQVLAAEPERLSGAKPGLVMSHLACAEVQDHAKNVEQWNAFERARALFPGVSACFANSSGIFLGSQFHYDWVRPGAALYGIAPIDGQPNPLAQVVRLEAKILQIRDVDSPMTVGYGATHRIAQKGRIATIAAGYADGLLRSAGNRGFGIIGGVRVPIVGRVSMDLITLDVSALPDSVAHPGALVEMLGASHTPDDMAAEAGTIGYEILTSIGRRYARRYGSLESAAS